MYQDGASMAEFLSSLHNLAWLIDCSKARLPPPTARKKKRSQSKMSSIPYLACNIHPFFNISLEGKPPPPFQSLFGSRNTHTDTKFSIQPEPGFYSYSTRIATTIVMRHSSIFRNLLKRKAKSSYFVSIQIIQYFLLLPPPPTPGKNYFLCSSGCGWGGGWGIFVCGFITRSSREK